MVKVNFKRLGFVLVLFSSAAFLAMSRPASKPITVAVEVRLPRGFKLNQRGPSKLLLSTETGGGWSFGQRQLEIDRLESKVVLDAPNQDFLIKAQGEVFFCAQEGRCYVDELKSAVEVDWEKLQKQSQPYPKLSFVLGHPKESW